MRLVVVTASVVVPGSVVVGSCVVSSPLPSVVVVILSVKKGIL